MIRRRDDERRLGIDIERLERRERHGGRGVAARRLEQDRRGGHLKARICSATVKRWASLHTTMGGMAPAIVARRAAVSCSMVCLPVRASSCFGYISRDSGQSRVPAPPERITGITVVTIYSL